MANEFTASKAWRFGGPEGKYLIKKVGTLVVDTPAGAAAADLPASMFGLSMIVESSLVVADDNSLAFGSAPAFDGGSLLTFATDPADESAEATLQPTDLAADTYRITITGY